MHFFKAVVSSAIIALPMAAMAAPAADSVASVDVNAPSEIDSLIAQLVGLVEAQQTPAVEARDVELEARAGFTCAFLGGNAGCQVKV